MKRDFIKMIIIVWVCLFIANLSFAVAPGQEWVGEYHLADKYTLSPVSSLPNSVAVSNIEAIITAYTSLEELTDNTPFITASGIRTREGIVANNCLDFGTIVAIDGKRYEVQDRMNKRYGCDRFDIWLPTYEEAKQFGVKKLKVVVYK